MTKKHRHRYYLRACINCTPIKECNSLDGVRNIAHDYPHYFLVEQWRERHSLLWEPTGQTWALSHFRKS